MSTDQFEQHEALQEKQHERQLEQARLQQAFNQQGKLKRGWMKEILDTDDLEEHLNEYEIQKIRGLINKQWILANLSDAETHDRQWKLAVQKLKIYGEFPPEESAIQGPIRAAIYDDPQECLFALSAEQRLVIDQIITSLQNAVTRSRDGFERKQTNTSIARTESEQNDTDDSGGISFFS